MKSNFYALLIALLISPIIKAQDQIESVGILKIGKSTLNVISELAKDYHGKVKEANDNCYQGDGSVIYKLVYSNNDDAPIHSSACPSTEVYYLKQYTATDITLIDVYLFFYEGLLTQVLSNGSDELDEILKTKYGIPTYSTKDSKSSCPNQVNKAYMYIWTNGDIETQVIKNYNYGSDCKISLDKYFTIKLPETEANANECHNINKDKAVNPKSKKI